jgi:cyclophilin family peptidyl-prolyl cis-trans isomerase
MAMKGAYTQIALLLVGSAFLVALLVLWYNFAHSPATIQSTEATEPAAEEVAPSPLTLEEQQRINPDNVNAMNPTAVMTTNYGVIELELFTDTMPVTAGNFVKLAEEGFYDGTKFHRVIDNFMIQGGDPLSKDDSMEARWGTGGPDYTIADEHIPGELLTNVRGTIAMANSGPNSGGSQFFINVADNTFLDFDKDPLTSKHPVFGRVIAGMDVVDTINGVATQPGDRPVEPVVVESVVITQP